MARVTGSGPAQLKSLGVRLKEADPRLRREMLRSFRRSATPIVRKVQASILSMPSVHGSPPGRAGLRDALARTVTSSARVTAKGAQLDIVSLGSRMPQGEGNMNAHVDARGGWGHPVFQRRGRETAWVRQRGRAQWFERPPIDSAKQVQDELQAAMDETARKLG
jgi:hypothetical protein